LPETEDELAIIAQILGARPESVYVREQATETQVRNVDLARYRIVAFATHGLLAKEAEAYYGTAEPALVLTPPREEQQDEDGLLTASEIATLEVDADWVILSACNTAAADGTPGAEGLSGLAKAFFYAGARTMLVSHWAVVSKAAVQLTTGMFAQLAATPELGRAEAMRKAMLALMETEGFAHPVYWAPFVVVGEGGPGSSAQLDRINDQ
jgi:CHAT domain-containing protein